MSAILAGSVLEEMRVGAVALDDPSGGTGSALVVVEKGSTVVSTDSTTDEAVRATVAGEEPPSEATTACARGAPRPTRRTTRRGVGASGDVEARAAKLSAESGADGRAAGSTEAGSGAATSDLLNAGSALAARRTRRGKSFEAVSAVPPVGPETVESEPAGEIAASPTSGTVTGSPVEPEPSSEGSTARAKDDSLRGPVIAVSMDSGSDGSPSARSSGAAADRATRIGAEREPRPSRRRTPRGRRSSDDRSECVSTERAIPVAIPAGASSRTS
jgi:hypothetical protein